MVVSIKEKREMEFQKDLESSSTKMETNIKESSRMDQRMGEVFIILQAVPVIKDSSQMIIKMDGENLIMKVEVAIKAIMKKEKEMEWECTSG